MRYSRLKIITKRAHLHTFSMIDALFRVGIIFLQLEFEWFPYPEYVTDDSPRSRIVLNISSIIKGILIFVSAVLIIHIIEEKDNGVKVIINLSVNNLTNFKDIFIT